MRIYHFDKATEDKAGRNFSFPTLFCSIWGWPGVMKLQRENVTTIYQARFDEHES